MTSYGSSETGSEILGTVDNECKIGSNGISNVSQQVSRSLISP